MDEYRYIATTSEGFNGTDPLKMDTDGDGLDMSAKMRLIGDSKIASSTNSTQPKRLLASAACTSNVTVSK